MWEPIAMRAATSCAPLWVGPATSTWAVTPSGVASVGLPSASLLLPSGSDCIVSCAFGSPTLTSARYTYVGSSTAARGLGGCVAVHVCVLAQIHGFVSGLAAAPCSF